MRQGPTRYLGDLVAVAIQRPINAGELLGHWLSPTKATVKLMIDGEAGSTCALRRTAISDRPAPRLGIEPRTPRAAK